jgi:hypothetical protein
VHTRGPCKKKEFTALLITRKALFVGDLECAVVKIRQNGRRGADYNITFSCLRDTTEAPFLTEHRMWIKRRNHLVTQKLSGE